LTLQDWLNKISAGHPKSIELGLDRVAAVAGAIGFAQGTHGIQLGGVSIVVGGTNGKGSTCATLESIALQSGFRVATYTSPHLLVFNERLRINGENVSDADLIAAFERVAAAQSNVSLTYFEFTTLACFDLIRRAGVDVAILEIGLGGRLDAVNIVDADCAVLVSVDMDHQDYLGDTREKIGWEKAHIARPGRPFVCADPEPPQSVLDVVASIGADIWRFGVDYNFQGDRQQWSWAGRGQRRNALAYPALRGTNQLLNASAALAAFAALRDRLPVTQGAVRAGLALVELPGRFQVLPGQPAVVLDVAHNPHSASVLAANLDQMGFFPNTYAVVGVLGGKDAAEIFRRMGDRIDHWCLAGLSGPDTNGRPRTAEDLRETLLSVLPNAKCSCFDGPAQAYAHARGAAEPNDRILVFGSFVTVAEIISLRHAR
jgi:dihydrofolate synthase / folylpolyglutamate synthase